jgi:hypothetical protein
MRCDMGDKVPSSVPRDFRIGTVIQARGRWGVQLCTVDWRDERGNMKVLSMPEGSCSGPLRTRRERE